MKTIKIEQLSKNYGDKLVLDKVSFEFKSGKILGIAGANGSGKTTLMSIISGLRRGTGGRICINGNDINSKKNNGKKLIGCLLENAGLYPNLTGYQNLDYFGTLIGKNQARNIVELTEKLMLQDFIDKKVKKYSLGMKQRLGLAVAMLGEPDFLILDEPTNGVDPEIIPKIRSLLKEYAKKDIGIMVSSHNLFELENICSRVLVLKSGKLIDEFILDEKESRAKVKNFVVSTSDNFKLKSYLTGQGYLFRDIEDAVLVMINSSSPSELIDELVGQGFQINSIAPYQQSLEHKFLNVVEED